MLLPNRPMHMWHIIACVCSAHVIRKASEQPGLACTQQAPKNKMCCGSAKRMRCSVAERTFAASRPHPAEHVASVPIHTPPLRLRAHAERWNTSLPWPKPYPAFRTQQPCTLDPAYSLSAHRCTLCVPASEAPLFRTLGLPAATEISAPRQRNSRPAQTC